MVGLQLFMVILTTASLSSKMNRDARWLDVCALGGEQNLDLRLIASQPLFFDICCFFFGCRIRFALHLWFQYIN